MKKECEFWRIRIMTSDDKEERFKYKVKGYYFKLKNGRKIYYVIRKFKGMRKWYHYFDESGNRFPHDIMCVKPFILKWFLNRHLKEYMEDCKGHENDLENVEHREKWDYSAF